MVWTSQFLAWCHELRNEIYHVNVGATPERAHVDSYAALAQRLFTSLFDLPPPSPILIAPESDGDASTVGMTTRHKEKLDILLMLSGEVEERAWALLEARGANLDENPLTNALDAAARAAVIEPTLSYRVQKAIEARQAVLKDSADVSAAMAELQALLHDLSARLAQAHKAPPRYPGLPDPDPMSILRGLHEEVVQAYCAITGVPDNAIWWVDAVRELAGALKEPEALTLLEMLDMRIRMVHGDSRFRIPDDLGQRAGLLLDAFEELEEASDDSERLLHLRSRSSRYFGGTEKE